MPGTRTFVWAHCFVLITALTSISQQAVPSSDPAGIFDGKGSFDANAYVSLANAYGTSAMIAERFGSPSLSYTTTHQWWQPPTSLYSNPTNGGDWFHYSLGSPCVTDPAYSSNYAQVAYVSDYKVSDSTPGVDGIATLEKAACVWTGRPQLYWAMGGGHGGHPTITLRTDLVARLDPFGMPRQPVEVTRAYGASEWAGCSYMVFQDGQVICGEGGNTAQDFFYAKPFPPEFTPTAASVTNNGEFLLVTGWNTATYHGELAIVAIGSSKPAGTFWGYEWDETYPGFRNYGLPVMAKLLGILELPGMRAPSAVEAVGNWVYQPGAFLPVPKGQSQDLGLPGKFSLSNQTHWQCFVNGTCGGMYDTGGFAVVASRYERKVLLVNLRPLFQAVAAGMFTSWNRFRTNVHNTGTGSGQWPPTFAENPRETPTIVKTITYPHLVTAISASLYADNRALIATDDGHVHIWDVDGLQAGNGMGSNAREIYDLGGVGRNVTRIAHMKHWMYGNIHGGGNGEMVRWQYIALSRENKTISWMDLSGPVPTIVRRLQDARLVDPISVEDNNNHQTQTDLIDIADYGDRTVKAYRYGPVSYWYAGSSKSFGMGPGGTDPFEYEGAFSVPTGPFSISTENIP